jgi:Sulfotransferase domain
MPNIGFLIIGAPKAGTTSLFEYMRLHPQVHMPAEKELYFFNVDGRYELGWDWYLAMMLRNAPPDAVCGEASTDYMRGAPQRRTPEDESPSLHGREAKDALEEVIPRRIKQCLPDVKLICMLRDPVERAYSHYLMRRMERVEPRSFEEAVDQLMEPTAMEHARTVPSRTNGYLVNGEYARLLAGFLRVFPREQLMVIFSDELAQEPTKTVSRVFDFIGVSSSFAPDNLGTRYREAAVKQRIPGLNLVTWRMSIARVRPARALWFALPKRVQRYIHRAYGQAGYRIELWNAQRHGVVDDEIPPAVRDRLTAHFLPDSEALAELVERDVPWLASWATGR